MVRKLAFALLIACVPFSALRRNLYRGLLGYAIPNSSRIGFLTVIAVSSFRVGERVEIGPLNLFKGPIDVVIGDDARIGRLNRFTCSWQITDERFAGRNYARRFSLGAGSLILQEHFFDVYGEIAIGDGTWIAGHGSQFWTHGVSVSDRDIRIGNNNYLGSAVRVAPGATLGNDNLVALGSVLLSKLDCNNSLVSGFPAKAIRSIAEDQAKGKYRFSFEDW